MCSAVRICTIVVAPIVAARWISVIPKINISRIVEVCLLAVVDEVIRVNPKSVKDFQAGKEKALMFLVGYAMRETKGKANARVVQRLLRERLRC